MSKIITKIISVITLLICYNLHVVQTSYQLPSDTYGFEPQERLSNIKNELIFQLTQLNQVEAGSEKPRAPVMCDPLDMGCTKREEEYWAQQKKKEAEELKRKQDEAKKRQDGMPDDIRDCLPYDLICNRKQTAWIEKHQHDHDGGKTSAGILSLRAFIYIVIALFGLYLLYLVFQHIRKEQQDPQIPLDDVSLEYTYDYESSGYDFDPYQSENQNVSRGFEYNKSINGSHNRAKPAGGTTDERKKGKKRSKKVKPAAQSQHPGLQTSSENAPAVLAVRDTSSERQGVNENLIDKKS